MKTEKGISKGKEDMKYAYYKQINKSPQNK
jgi:hypothetical protein